MQVVAIFQKPDLPCFVEFPCLSFLDFAFVVLLPEHKVVESSYSRLGVFMLLDDFLSTLDFFRVFLHVLDSFALPIFS